MKKTLFITICALFSYSVFGQNLSVIQPRLRINRTSSLSITTSWQTIDFNGTSTYNVNTFGIDPTSGNSMVWWDGTNRILRFYGMYDRNFIMTLYLSTTTTIITTRATLQYRLVIPNGISAGVDLYVPFPETGGYGDVGEITVLAATAMYLKPEVIPFYVTQIIRANGFYVQLRLSNSLFTAGTCTLNNAALLVQASNN